MTVEKNVARSWCVLQSLDDDPPPSMAMALPGASRLSQAMPLVRVAIPHPLRERHKLEWVDVLQHGRLRVEHKSGRSRSVEVNLGAPDSLYFHGGRAHPDYGTMVFILAGLPETHECEASPSGLGTLSCTSGSALDDAVSHGCLAPVSHWHPDDQRRYYRQSTWKGAWRPSAAKFLAGYFGAKGVEAYFAHGEAGRPDRADPAGVFHNPSVCDWRAWTIEVRCMRDLDLYAALREGTLLAWGISSNLRRLAETRLVEHGDELPFYEALCANLPDRELRGGDGGDGDGLVMVSLADAFSRRVMEAA